MSQNKSSFVDNNLDSSRDQTAVQKLQAIAEQLAADPVALSPLGADVIKAFRTAIGDEVAVGRIASILKSSGIKCHSMLMNNLEFLLTEIKNGLVKGYSQASLVQFPDLVEQSSDFNVKERRAILDICSSEAGKVFKKEYKEFHACGLAPQRICQLAQTIFGIATPPTLPDAFMACDEWKRAQKLFAELCIAQSSLRPMRSKLEKRAGTVALAKGCSAVVRAQSDDILLPKFGQLLAGKFGLFEYTESTPTPKSEKSANSAKASSEKPAKASRKHEKR